MTDLGSEQRKQPSGDGLLRFNLAMQRSRGVVYVFALIFGTLAVYVGVLDTSLLIAYPLIFIGVFSSGVFYYAYKSGLDRRVSWNLIWVWLLLDSAAVTTGVYFSGGVESVWYLFYIAVSASAAFAAGSRASWIISCINATSYLALLLITGMVKPLDLGFYRALYQIGFLYFASAFFISGVANLREKRLLIRQLREEDRRRVAELTSLTDELDLKSRELATASQTIRQADHLKSQFLASMSHELRTPMNAIIGFSEILSERLEGKVEAKHHGFIRHILSSGQHLLGIINDVLDLSKIEAGRMEIFPESFQASQVATEVISVMKVQASKADLEITLDLPDDLPPIETDLPKLRQILFNLLSNAVKFSPDGSTIRVTGHVEGDPESPLAEMSISVADEGSGIKPEHRDSIFEEFSQVEASHRAEMTGTGLGLALVKKFCELLGGTVSVESEEEKGSVFTVRLPLRYTGPEPVVESGDLPALIDSEQPRVLVVEDDDLAFDSISRHLLSASYVPVRARHGEEALRLAKDVRPVAVTLDLVLPGLDGWEVLKRLKADAETTSIPVVIISMIDNRELGMALGAHDYFVKPIDRRRLIERIRQVTSKTKERRVRRILVIDDDPSFRELLGEDLSTLGYTVSWAMSGEDGIALARSELPDVIVLDLVMPGMSGFEVAEKLKHDEDTVNIPILVMTSKDLTSTDRSQLHSKIAALLPKGRYPASRLITAIQQLGR